MNLRKGRPATMKTAVLTMAALMAMGALGACNPIGIITAPIDAAATVTGAVL